jgi:hypothetical protein
MVRLSYWGNFRYYAVWTATRTARGGVYDTRFLQRNDLGQDHPTGRSCGRDSSEGDIPDLYTRDLIPWVPSFRNIYYNVLSTSGTRVTREHMAEFLPLRDQATFVCRKTLNLVSRAGLKKHARDIRVVMQE